MQRSPSVKEVISSNDGSKHLGLTETSILLSLNSGASWRTLVTQSGRTWESITASSDASKIAASVIVYPSGGTPYRLVYTSQDGGASWIQRGNLPTDCRWFMSSSSSGSLLVLAAYGKSLYTSNDWGESWKECTSAGSRGWWEVASSPDGQRIVATVRNGPIFVSGDQGATWVRTNAASKQWAAVASSNAGLLIACTGTDNQDYIHFSHDFGVTWERQDGAGAHGWSDLALSEDGSRVVASAVDLKDNRGWGYLYTYTFGPPSGSGLLQQ